MSGMDPERRRRLLEAVASWLDDLPEEEPAPPGTAPEVLTSSDAAPDLFSLFGQLAALTRETQLQGRATNRLHAELSAALEELSTNLPSLEEMARRLTEARRDARLELMLEFLEVRDRFARGLGEAERRLAALRGFRAWLGQRPVLEALIEGNRLARDRFDDLLRRLDVHEIPCLGKSFDPTLMRAVEAVESTAAPPGTAPGTVIEVLRPGYTSDGQVLRFAEVRVVAGPSTWLRTGTGGDLDG